MEPITLSATQPGKQYVVKEIKDEARLVNRLSSMGVMCGSQVEVCEHNKKQPVLIFTRDTLVAIGREAILCLPVPMKKSSPRTILLLAMPILFLLWQMPPS